MSPMSLPFTEGSPPTIELMNTQPIIATVPSNDCHMHRTNPNVPYIPLKDHREAVARAIAWLGDRYLLANPVNVTARANVLPHSPESGASNGMHVGAHVGGQRSSTCRRVLEVTS